MAIKVGINGFGRISRVVIRVAMSDPEIEICGINVRNADVDYMKYMLKYDSTFGRFPKELDVYKEGTKDKDAKQGLIINGKKVPVFSEEHAGRGACTPRFRSPRQRSRFPEISTR